jgi:hypothetical protein
VSNARQIPIAANAGPFHHEPTERLGMRTLLFVLAAIFILGGSIAIVRPQPAIVPHQGTPYSPATTETLPASYAKVYGVVSLRIGAAVLLAAITWKKSDELD